MSEPERFSDQDFLRYLEGELPQRRADELARHVEANAEAQARLASARELTTLLEMDEPGLAGADLKAAVRGIEIHGHKIHSSFKRPVTGVITRALETIPKTLSRVSGCLVKSGLAIFMKGPQCDEELEAARRMFGEDYRLVQDRAYVIPHSPHRRRLLVFERISDPTSSAPVNGDETPTFP